MIFSTFTLIKLSASTCPATVQDIEGNTYDVVRIGEQCWMAENLKTTKYNDNSDIEEITDGLIWNTYTEDAYCWMDNDYETNGVIYGALYNWFAVGTGKLCPEGWHVPSDEEWKELEMYLGMTQAMADSAMWRGNGEVLKIKDAVMDGNNSTGFSALPGGWRVHNIFSSFERGAYFWTSTELNETEAYSRLFFDDDGPSWSDPKKMCRTTIQQDLRKQNGMSVRCIKRVNE